MRWNVEERDPPQSGRTQGPGFTWVFFFSEWRTAGGRGVGDPDSSWPSSPLPDAVPSTPEPVQPAKMESHQANGGGDETASTER
jgi:hypothetical protein